MRYLKINLYERSRRGHSEYLNASKLHCNYFNADKRIPPPTVLKSLSIYIISKGRTISFCVIVQLNEDVMIGKPP